MTENNKTAAELYEAGLRRLDDLIAIGLGDSKEADAVRDSMDEPWSHLSEKELAEIHARNPCLPGK